MTKTSLSLPDESALWTAVSTRDPAYDGLFVYAVGTTGVFCRPTCPSRRPKRENTCFFPAADQARAAGFRPCRRCRPEQASSNGPHVEAIAKVCEAIAAAEDGIPTLAELSEIAGLSPHHLQKVFKKATGLSPRKYAEALRSGKFRQELRNGESVASALYGAGYGSPSRVYEDSAARMGMTPATYARGGAGAEIVFACAESPLGRLLVAATGTGVCFVGLGDSDQDLEAELRGDLPAARIERDDGALAGRLEAVLDHLQGRSASLDLPLDIRATAFQWQVWQALRAIPAGQTRTYGEIAEDLGRPKAARAVGRACATNPVSLVVPCHRAIGSDGGVTGYRWGVDRKAKLLEDEKKRAAPE